MTNRTDHAFDPQGGEASGRAHGGGRAEGGGMGYGRFAAMIATSTVVMFGLMYLNVWSIEHVWYSETRTYMAIYMGAMMAIIMLAFMLGMYTNRAANLAIFAGAAIVLVVAVSMMRAQTFIGDVGWMKAMIPHHSIAILTSERADISDPRVRALADEIIAVQRDEIAEMERYIADIEANGDAPAGTPREKE